MYESRFTAHARKGTKRKKVKSPEGSVFKAYEARKHGQKNFVCLISPNVRRNNASSSGKKTNDVRVYGDNAFRRARIRRTQKRAILFHV